MIDTPESEFQPLRDLQGREMQLLRRGFSTWASYDLVAGSDRLGSLRFASGGADRAATCRTRLDLVVTPVMVTLAAGSWEIRARDWFSIQVQTVPAGRECAIIRTNWLHLLLDLADGSRFVGGYETLSVWAWRDSQGHTVLRHDTPLATLGGLKPTSRFWFADGCESQAYADVLTAVALKVATGVGSSGA